MVYKSLQLKVGWDGGVSDAEPQKITFLLHTFWITEFWTSKAQKEKYLKSIQKTPYLIMLLEV